MTPEDAATLRRLSVSAVLTECAKMLREPDTERAQAIAVLRDICLDDDWPDDLHLVDILEKYVRPHMPAPAPVALTWTAGLAVRADGKCAGSVHALNPTRWCAIPRHGPRRYFRTENEAKAYIEGLTS